MKACLTTAGSTQCIFLGKTSTNADTSFKGMKNELKHVTFTGAVEAFKCSGDKDSLPLGNEQMLFIVFKSNVVKLVNITSHKTWLTYLLGAPLLSFSHF